MFDLLFGITEWLRTTVLLDFAFWLMETPLSLFMVENFWMVPLAQVFHILAIGAAFGTTLLLTVRINRSTGASQTVSEAAARYCGWTWWGLLVIILSGVLMATAEPIRNMVNAVFWIKMALIIVTVLITLGFQKSVRAKAAAAGAAFVASSGMRTTSILIVILWCVIILCGRWIAYVPV
ncbi:hypothetical protein GCM10009127_25800 [Alteraurantiacibacter aestuarii]|uniref:DUF6644 family protein n=1 Tax=Alteraurantiacibacter aestuarii TaxID=650004 RepID=UPI0031D39653